MQESALEIGGWNDKQISSKLSLETKQLSSSMDKI